MHSPQCPRVVSGLRTVPLPKRGQVITIDGDGSTGIVVHEGGAFWLSWPTEASAASAFVLVTYEDGSTQLVSPDPGVSRFVVVERVRDVVVDDWPAGAFGSIWAEDLSALESTTFAPACARCGGRV